MITYKTFLMVGSGTAGNESFTKLVDIFEHSDLGGTPESIDVTTLSDKVQKNENGVQQMDSITASAPYTPADFKKLKDMEGAEKTFAIWYGGTEDIDGTATPTGIDGKFTWKGRLSVFATGSTVNESRKMNISISNTTAIAFDDGTTI